MKKARAILYESALHKQAESIAERLPLTRLREWIVVGLRLLNYSPQVLTIRFPKPKRRR